MPDRTRPRIPKYRHFKPKDLAVVRIDGRDRYLGRYGSEASKEKYRRVVAAWLAGTPPEAEAPGGQAGPSLSVAELILAYLRHADTYYRKNGRPTNEPANIRLALKPLRQLYGLTAAAEFGPRALKAVRQAMIGADLCRAEINKRVGRVGRLFKWAVENELVPPGVYHGLKAVSGLRRGRSEAREGEPVRPVPDEHVDALEAVVAPQIWAMIQLQRLTGMRPGEVCLMRTGDVDMRGEAWAYRPHDHKTAHHGRERVIHLGPRAQAVLKPWLRADPMAYLFSPKEVLEARFAELRRNRRTPMTPSQRARKRVRRRKRAPGERYTTGSYGQAIATGCRRAKVPHWHAHQLRHNAATWLRKEFGLDVARTVLGHSTPVVTEVYAEADSERAAEAMRRVG